MPEIDDIKSAAAQLLAWYEKGGEEDARLQDGLVQTYSCMLAKALLDIIRVSESGEADRYLYESLEAMLKRNWDFVKGTALGYTALPRYPVTRLLCAVASYVVKEKAGHRIPSLPAIAVLMPGISLESIYDSPDYPSFDETCDLSRVLQTHILDQRKRAFLPVRLLTGIETSEHRKALINPYFNTDVDGSMSAGSSLEAIGRLSEQSVLVPEEIERLSEHSDLTRAVLSAKKNYELLLNDSSNLLGHLTELCRHLALNNAYGGIGSQENAGGGAYPAIIAFSRYYEALGDEMLKIPAPLKLEIEKLLDFSSDRDANRTATVSLETCIANRRLALLAAMQGNEGVLSQIGAIAGEAKIGLLAKAKADFIAAKQDLKAALDSDSYLDGQDLQGLTSDLLHAFDFTLSFEAPKDLEMIKQLRPEEITSIMTDAALQKQFVIQIECIENLVLFALEIAPEKLRALLQSTRRELLLLMIKRAEDLAALLISLDPERCELICDVFKKDIRNISASDALNAVLEHLTSEQRSAFFRSMKSQTDWYCMIYLPEGRSQLALMVKNAMVSTEPLVKSIDFTKMLNWAVRRYDDASDLATEIFKMINSISADYSRGDELSALIRNIDDFKYTDKDLNVFCDEIEHHIFFVYAETNKGIPLLTRAIQYGKLDIFKRLVELGADWNLPDYRGRTPLLEAFYKPTIFRELLKLFPNMIEDVNRLIKTGDDLYELLEQLELSEHASQNFISIISDALGMKRFGALMETVKGLAVVLQCVQPKKHAAIYAKYHERMPAMIKRAQDFDVLFRSLSEPERDEVFSNIGSRRVAQLIKTGDDFDDVIDRLSIEEMRSVFNEMFERLPKIISSSIGNGSARCHKVFSCLCQEQSESLLLSIQEKLPSMINTEEDLINFVAEQNNHEIVINALTRKQPGTFPTGGYTLNGLRSLSQQLTPDQFKEVLNRMPIQGINDINSIKQLNESLSQIKRTYWLIFIKALMPRLSKDVTGNRFLPGECSSERLRDPNNYNRLFEMIKQHQLTPEESVALLKGMEHLISSELDLGISDVLDDLPETHRSAVLIDLTNSRRFSSVDELCLCLDYLPPNNLASTLCSLSVLIYPWMETADDVTNHFRKLLTRLPREDVAITLRSFTGFISQKITTVYELKVFFKTLRPEIREIAFHEFKDTLIRSIVTLRDLDLILSEFDHHEGSILLSSIIDHLAPLVISKADFQRLRFTFTAEARASNRSLQLIEKVLTIAEHQAGANDTKLRDYVDYAKRRIIGVKTPDGFDVLDREFSAMLRSVSCVQVRAVRQYVDELRRKRDHLGTLWKDSCISKAQVIETALCNMEPQTRGNALVAVVGELNPVIKAINIGRVSGGMNLACLAKVETIVMQLRSAELTHQIRCI